MFCDIIAKLGSLFFLVVFKSRAKFRSIIMKKRDLKFERMQALEASYYVHEANELGIDSRIIMDNVVQVKKDKIVHNFWRCGTDLDGMATLHIAGDKVHCLSVLKQAGTEVPKFKVLKRGDCKSAIEFMKQCNGSIVIKPARDTGDGAGVFIKPENKDSIFFAVNYAGIFGKEIIVEEYFSGTNYRLLYCKGKFLGASARLAARVVGDGRTSIEKLIELENRRRRRAGDIVPYGFVKRPLLYEIMITRKLKKVLERQGLKLTSIAEAGKRILLQDVCHWFDGGEYVDVTDEISPEFVEIGRRAVEALGIKLAGVDMIALDTKRAEKDNYVINEVNTTPALLIHYEVQNQERMRPVARDILRIMFGME